MTSGDAGAPRPGDGHHKQSSAPAMPNFPVRRTRLTLAGTLIGAPAAILCAMLAWPFIFGAGWPQLPHTIMTRADWGAVWVSFLCAAADVLLMIAFATPVAWILARKNFPGKMLLELVVLIPLLTPPLAMGMLLANVLGPESAVGQLAAQLDISLTNSIPALIIAGFYAAAPVYVVAARLAFASVDPAYEQIARLLEHSRLSVWLRITLPLAMGGLFWAIGIAWLRALGEFGVAIIIAYFPHGIPIQMWVNLQDTGPRAVYPLLWILLLGVVPVPLLANLRYVWRKERRRTIPVDPVQIEGGREGPAAAQAVATRAGRDGPRRSRNKCVNIELYIDHPVTLKATFELRGITALTGPTGSGKSTLLRAVAGLIPSRAGNEMHNFMRCGTIGYAPQEPVLFKHLSVWKNVAFGIHSPDVRNQALNTLRLVNLEHLADNMPSTLSAGQAQLVSVARAIVRKPDLLLLDEPTAALDGQSADMLMRLLRDIAAAGIVRILLATHDRDIAGGADHRLTINRGEILTSSP